VAAGFRFDDAALRVFARRDLPDAAAGALRAAVESERRRVVAEQSARSGGTPPDLAAMVVDGQRGAGPERIGHNSRILLDWNYLREAVGHCVKHLRDLGPVREGGWRNSIAVFVDDKETDPAAIAADATHAAVVVTVPYARRLEVGRDDSGGAFAVQVPQHFVERSMMALRADHSDLARWSFGYTDLSDGHALTVRWQHKRLFWKGGGFRKWSSRRHETHVRYPTIHIDEIQAA